MANGETVMEALSWEPERGSQLLLVERETGQAVATVPLGERYCLHLVNAFEAEGRLVVDVVELDRPIYDQYQTLPNLFTDVARPRTQVAMGQLEPGTGKGLVKLPRVLPEAFGDLARRNVQSEDLVDELCVTLAPLIVGGPSRRILHGPEVPGTALLALAHVLTEDHYLFLRYLVDRELTE